MVLWKIKKPNSLRKHAEVMSFATNSGVSLSSVCMLYKSSGRDVSEYYAGPMLTVDLHHKPKALVTLYDWLINRTTLTQQWDTYMHCLAITHRQPAL